jgi:hypothetical protein
LELVAAKILKEAAKLNHFLFLAAVAYHFGGWFAIESVFASANSNRIIWLFWLFNEFLLF